MRALADAARVRRFLQALGARAQQEIRVYLTGGATAVLHGWRPTTVDVDIKIVPDSDEMLQAIPELKESLQINVELASPDQFIPELPGWQERSPFIGREGKVSIYHYDLYAQALSKIERGHARDVADAEEMVRRGLVEPRELLRLFGEIEPSLYRYPAIDPAGFRRRVEVFLERQRGS
jgi:hypothetical protein